MCLIKNRVGLLIFYRNSTSERLGVFIQNNVLEDGHDSSADARAALDLVKWKVKQESI